MIVRAVLTPEPGQYVSDSRGRRLGKVVRITGPVSSPYVLIMPLAKDEVSMFRQSGKEVFLDDAPFREAKQRRPRARSSNVGGGPRGPQGRSVGGRKGSRNSPDRSWKKGRGRDGPGKRDGHKGKGR